MTTLPMHQDHHLLDLLASIRWLNGICKIQRLCALMQHRVVQCTGDAGGSGRAWPPGGGANG